MTTATRSSSTTPPSSSSCWRAKPLLDFEDRETVSLKPHQGYTVPTALSDRTRAPVRTAILMVEAEGVAPTGD